MILFVQKRNMIHQSGKQDSSARAELKEGDKLLRITTSERDQVRIVCSVAYRSTNCRLLQLNCLITLLNVSCFS